MEIEKCNGNREGNTIVISEMHSEFCSWKLKKCNGNSEGNTIVISEMHMPEFL